MKLAHPILILLLLTGASAAQLAPDRDRFDIELHPGEVGERTLTLTNVGDSPIHEIEGTPMGGSASEFIFLEIPDDRPLEPGDEVEVNIFFAIPPEADPGYYTGFMYLIDDRPPSMPARIEFFVDIIDEESYDISLSIDDARSASTYAKADEPALFDLTVTNLGKFRDVTSIDAFEVPDEWRVSLIDGEDEVDLPYNLPIAPGVSHEMKLQVESATPGMAGRFEVTATSLGNQSENATVEGDVKFGLAIRGYHVEVMVPERITVNRTYTGSFIMALDVSEDVQVAAMAPPDLMVIPVSQIMAISPEEAGRANFTILATKTGMYPLVFNLMDSNGIPMPEEMAAVTVVEPTGTAILTGEDLRHQTVASLCRPDNDSPSVFSVSYGALSQKDREGLYAYSKVFIFGGDEIVSPEAEEVLEGVMEVERIEGEGICDASWLLISNVYRNGTDEVVLSGNENVDIFRGYQKAKELDLPMAICGGGLSDATISIIEDLMERDVALSKVLAVGSVDEDAIEDLEDLGIEVEEVSE